MDQSAHSASVFDKLADKYREKYMDVSLYNDSYRAFCELLPPGRARVLDAACGPGSVAQYLTTQRPELDLLGIDLAPRMVELARKAVPSARFLVHDCRNLAALNQRFNGIICAFGLPYLSAEEATAFIQAAAGNLDQTGVLYLSVMLGRSDESGLEPCSTGDLVHITYYTEDQIIGSLDESGFTIVAQKQIRSPNAAAKATTDLIVVAKR